MTRATIFLALLVLLAAGCGSEEAAAPSGSPETAGGETGGGETGASGLPTRPVTINASGGEEVEVMAEIADDNAERQKGLMDRPEGSLAESAGMLFVFKGEKPLSFWMKDTLIPLSIAYIAEDGRIVDIQDMEPLDTTGHPSAEPARYALEVNQGFFGERGVEVGDMLEVPENLR